MKIENDIFSIGDQIMVNPTDIIEAQVVKETSMSFTLKVEDKVWMKDIPYLEAIAELVEELGLEPSGINRLLTPELKIKLQQEAESLSLLKK